MMERKLKKPNEVFKNIYSREAPIQSLDVENRTIKGVMATELPAVVADWYNWRAIREIILIDGLEIPERIPLLDAHSRFQISDIKGSVINAQKTREDLLGPIVIADYVFSSTAEKEFTLVREGHLDSTSIGYEIFPDQSVELKPGEQKEVAGKLYKNDYPDKLPLVIRLKARVFENSLVPIGADEAAKFRSMFPPSEDDDELKKNLEELRNEISEIKKTTITINKGESKMEEKNQEQTRVDAIKKLAETFRDKVKGVNLDETAQLFIHGNKTEREFADFIFEKQKAAASFGEPKVNLSKQEIKNYNIFNGLRALYRGENSFEKEVSDEYVRQTGMKIEGLALPYDVLLPKMFQRDLQATGVNAGKDLVGTDHLGNMFIDYLYSKLVFDNITLLPNRKGNVEIPVLTGSAGFGWAATENANLSEGSPTTDLKTASPKRGGRYIDVSKQLMIQSDPPAEALFVNDLIKSIALGIQNAVLNGSGSSGEPRGVKNTSGLPSTIDLSSVSWQKFVEFESVIDDNFGEDKSMYFVTRRSHRGKLKATPKELGQAIYICDNENRVNGYEMRTTNIVTSGDVFFGDWSQVVVPMWDALDLVVDPYTQAISGLVRITAQQLIDVIVRYPQAFAYGNGFVD